MKRTTLFKLRYWFLSSFILSSFFIANNALSSAQVSSDYSTGVTDVIVSFAKAILPPADIVIIPVASLDLALPNQETEISIGASVNVTAIFTPNNTTDQSLLWTSSNDEVFTINSAGVLTARGLGEAIITATTSNPSISANLSIEVVALPIIDDFELFAAIEGEATNTLEKDMSLSVKIINQTPIDASIEEVVFTSSDTNILSVNAYGVVRGISQGSASVSAQIGLVDRSVEITVVDEIDVIVPTDIQLSADEVGYVGRLMYLTHDFGSTLPTDTQITLISSHPAVGSVSAEGVVTIRDFIGLEEQNITFTIYANGNFNVFDSVDVRIQKVFPEMIAISHITSIEAGKTLEIAPTFSPIDVTDQQLDFVSSHSDIAVVSTKGSTGIIFAKSIGQTTISATSRMDGNIQTIFTINVIAPTLITENVIDAIHLFVRKGIGHVGLNFFNGFLGFFTFYAFLSNRKSLYMTLSILTGIFLGFTFESLQFFAPGRSPEWLDGLYNTIGYLGAQALLFLFMAIFQRNQEKKKQPKKT